MTPLSIGGMIKGDQHLKLMGKFSYSFSVGQGHKSFSLCMCGVNNYLQVHVHTYVG